MPGPTNTLKNKNKNKRKDKGKGQNKNKSKTVTPPVIPASLGSNSDVENRNGILVTVEEEGRGCGLVCVGRVRDGGSSRSEHLSVDGLGESDGFSPSLDETDPPFSQHIRTHTPDIGTDTSLSPPSSCIEDRWNGPRVLDIVAFLASPHAAPPSMSDEACQPYVVPEVCGLMQRALPEENALILWYNKTRSSARICPACRRFYTLSDILLPHLIDDQSRASYVDPRNLREKRISGLCSLTCFGIASYNWPGCINAWGTLLSQLDIPTQRLLAGPGANIADDGMGAFMKLSRVDDLVGVLKGVWGCM